jgi:cytochrome c oxidase subunit 2
MTIKLLLLKSGEDMIASVAEMGYGEGEDRRVVGYYLNKPCVIKMRDPNVLDDASEGRGRKAGYEVSQILYIFLSYFVAFNAYANQPKDWQLGFQEAASSTMRDIVNFHDKLLLPIIIAISVFVLFLMVYACIRFRASRNPNPSKTTHNVAVEVLWTLIPCLILIVMAVPSFKILYKQDTIPKADVTVKAIGYQWYWGYEYPDENIIFDSYMIETKDLKENQPRLLAVDNEVVVPVNKVVKVLITANDVLHAWALPSFGVKRDAVPGRINETWFKAEKVGTYYGQCSELCGIKHAFMPITVRVVSEEEYAEWLRGAKIKFAKEIIEEDQFKKLASK